MLRRAKGKRESRRRRGALQPMLKCSLELEYAAAGRCGNGKSASPGNRGDESNGQTQVAVGRWRERCLVAVQGGMD
jgi:hypothetical protein